MSLRQTVERLAREGEDFAIDAPENWGQGRTLYGGMTAALSYEAAKHEHGDLGQLRSAHFTFIGPASGRLRFRSEMLRKGRSSAIVSTDCRSEEGAAARSIFVFGGPRESVITHDFTPRPDVPAPEACEPFHNSRKPVRGFVENFELRIAAGSRMFQPGEKPEFVVWARLREDDGADPVTALLATADSLPPAAMVSFPNVAFISTMTWAIDLFQPPALSSGWRLVSSSSEHASEGYSLQSMMMWDETGEPLAAGRQVVALFI